MNKFVKTIDKDDLVFEYIKSINGLLKLPRKELELLVELVKLDMDYKKVGNIPKNIVDTKNRKHIMATLNITRDNLSTYIKKLRGKGLIIKDGPDRVFVRPELKPILIRDTVQTTLILKVKDGIDS